MHVLEVLNVNKGYGGRPVLRDVSFTVGHGRMTGFVGANGAGKTTTMRIILGVLSSDSGSVSLGGTRLTAEDRRRFGYMPEERGLYPKMRVHEQLVYLARLHGFTPAAAARNASALLEQLGLGERANDAVESLSLGNQQRAQIAAALVHEPEVLVLDEPFSGLDPMAVDVVLGVLQGHAASGAPVLFSSHQLDIVERLCDDLVIIADGQIRANGSTESLRQMHGSSRYEIQLGPGRDALWLGETAGVTVVEHDGGYALFEAGDEARAVVLARAVADGALTRFGPHAPSLAQVFREVIR